MHMVCRLLNEINRLALVPLWRLLPVNILWRRSRRFAQEKCHKIVSPRNDDGFKAMSSCRRGSYRAAKKCEVSRLVVKEGNTSELARHAWEQMSWQMNSQRSLHWGQRRKKRFIYHVTPLMRLHHHRRIVGSSFTARRRLFGAKNVRIFGSFPSCSLARDRILCSPLATDHHINFSHLILLIELPARTIGSRLANWWISEDFRGAWPSGQRVSLILSCWS